MSHNQVLDFQIKFDAAVRDTPSINVPEKWFRFDLIAEEFTELGTAHATDNFVEVADALGDILFVVYGAGITFGLDLPNAVEKGRKLAESLDMYSKDSTGPLSDAGRAIILDVLRGAIESSDVKRVESTLAAIIVSVEYAAKILDIPLTRVVDAIYKSNLSKLGEDGKPIYVEYNGALKIGKGPNYKAPTEDIVKILAEHQC